MSTTCNASLQFRYFRQPTQKGRHDKYDFSQHFQGDDRNFHRITGTCIWDRETLNRR